MITSILMRDSYTLIWVLEELINQGQDPDWDYLGLDEFQNLLTARPSAETTDTSYFLEKYGNISLSEQLLPDVSLLDFKNSTTAREEKTSLGTDAGKRRKNINSVTRSSEGYDESSEDVGTNVKSRVEKVFDSWDENGDGSLSALEIKTALEREESENTEGIQPVVVKKIVKKV